jgi:hypothetical protein
MAWLLVRHCLSTCRGSMGVRGGTRRSDRLRIPTKLQRPQSRQRGKRARIARYWSTVGKRGDWMLAAYVAKECGREMLGERTVDVGTDLESCPSWFGWKDWFV